MIFNNFVNSPEFGTTMPIIQHRAIANITELKKDLRKTNNKNLCN